MRKLTTKFVNWCADDSAAARFERTVVQGIIGVGAGILASVAADNPTVGMYVAPAVMAILAPIQGAIGNSDETKVGGTE